MAAPALRVAIGELPARCTVALRAALRPSPRPPTSQEDEAHVRRRQGAVASRRLLGMRAARPTTTAAALAVAALQQPPGTCLARTLALASGRVFLPECGGVPAPGHGDSWNPVASAALAVAAACHPNSESTAAVAVASGAFRRWRRRTCNVVKSKRAAAAATGSAGRSPSGEASEALPSLYEDGAASSPSSSSPLLLCQDTSYRVLQQLWPPIMRRVSSPSEVSSSPSLMSSRKPAELCPQTFEERLRRSCHVLQSLQQVSAVSADWARHADQDAWPAAFAYLYQERGSKSDLRRRYALSMRRLLVKDWVHRGLGGGVLPPSATSAPGPGDLTDSLSRHILTFVA